MDSRDLGARASGCREDKGYVCLGGTLLVRACCSCCLQHPPRVGEDFSGSRSPRCVPRFQALGSETHCVSPLISQDKPPSGTCSFGVSGHYWASQA